MTYEDQIKERIKIISRDNLVQKPLTVVGAAKLIAEYDGYPKAIELFEGAAEEVKGNLFRSSAYESTLETVLYKSK
jgi:hypothetical protein